MTEYLKCYTTYVNNYNNAVQILTDLENSSEAFTAYLKTLTTSSIPGKGLYTYLIMPIQRVPRYILLLQELIKHTRPSHPDYEPLKVALKDMSDLADYIDECKSAYNESKHIVDLQKRIIGFPKDQTLIAPKRVYLKEGALHINELPYWVLLFSDLILLTILIPVMDGKKKKQTKQTYNFERLVSLQGADLVETTDPTSFSIRGKNFVFKCSTESADEKVYWQCAFSQSVLRKL